MTNGKERLFTPRVRRRVGSAGENSYCWNGHDKMRENVRANEMA
jgi:hypothetical protein